MNLWFRTALFDPVWKGQLPSRHKAFGGFQKKPESRLFRSVSGVVMVKSLARAGAGPVVLLHTKKVEPGSKKPNGTWRAPNCFAQRGN